MYLWTFFKPHTLGTLNETLPLTPLLRQSEFIDIRIPRYPHHLSFFSRKTMLINIAFTP